MDRDGWWSTRDERRAERQQRRAARHALKESRRKGRASLSVERIADAALAIVDQEGLGALSLRRLARELGVGATTIYWYVRDKNELLALARDRTVAEQLAILPTAQDWRSQVEAFARGLRATLLRHSGAAVIWGMRPALGPNALEVLERLLAAFVQAGLSDQDAADAAVVLLNFVIGSASWQIAESRPEDPDRVEEVRRAREYVASLPAERLPNIRRLSARFLGETADARFELGLAALLDGFAARPKRAGWTPPVAVRAE